jgi:hypothetical protein
MTHSPIPDADDITAGDTATETHHEPHGGAMPHGAADDIEEHGQTHEAEAEPIGPVDTRAWGAALLGIALGLLVAACFAVATAGVRV